MTSSISNQDVIALSEQEITSNLASNQKEQILKGLFRGSIGFLIAPPDSGKSYLALSIAYEVALPEYPLIGVSHNNNKALKTLIWPIEDSLPGTLPRIQTHLSRFSLSVKERLKENVGIYCHADPICCSGGAKHTKEWQEASKSLDKLIKTAKSYDLIIIDTLRDAVGSANVVEDDYYIRIALERLAHEADAAVLVVHHPTKEVSRGKEIINSVSGSGLSSTLSKSKLHFYLDQVIDKKDGTIQETRLRHIKANYIPYDQQWKRPIQLHWSEGSLLHVDSKSLMQLELEEVSQERKTQKVSRKRLSQLSEKQVLIERNDALLSEESKRLAEQTTHGPFGSGMASELSELRTIKSKL